MRSPVIDALRQTNGRIKELTIRLHNTERCVSVSRQDFEDLGGELSLAAIWLRKMAPGSMLEEELARELSDYRENLEHLQKLLPSFQRRLLTEKARLEIEAAHRKAAEAWASASRIIF